MSVLYDFEVIREMLAQYEGEQVGDKEAGVRLGMSERRVREMRADGMTEWDLDVIAVRRFGLMPCLIVGWDEWFAPALQRTDELTEAV